MAVFSKCMFTLPLVGSILRRGEDGRDVKNGMTSFTNFFKKMTWAWAWAWAWAFARTFAFACHVHAQNKNFQGTSCRACSLAAAPLGGQCCTLSRVESPGMTCTAGTKLVSRKQHNKLTAFVARVWTAQWRQPIFSVCVCGVNLLAAADVAEV